MLFRSTERFKLMLVMSLREEILTGGKMSSSSSSLSIVCSWFTLSSLLSSVIVDFTRAYRTVVILKICLLSSVKLHRYEASVGAKFWRQENLEIWHMETGWAGVNKLKRELRLLIVNINHHQKLSTFSYREFLSKFNFKKYLRGFDFCFFLCLQIAQNIIKRQVGEQVC